jgi:hypothetical protein
VYELGLAGRGNCDGDNNVDGDGGDDDENGMAGAERQQSRSEVRAAGGDDGVRLQEPESEVKRPLGDVDLVGGGGQARRSSDRLGGAGPALCI